MNSTDKMTAYIPHLVRSLSHSQSKCHSTSPRDPRNQTLHWSWSQNCSEKIILAFYYTKQICEISTKFCMYIISNNIKVCKESMPPTKKIPHWVVIMWSFLNIWSVEFKGKILKKCHTFLAYFTSVATCTAPPCRIYSWAWSSRLRFSCGWRVFHQSGPIHLFPAVWNTTHNYIKLPISKEASCTVLTHTHTQPHTVFTCFHTLDRSDLYRCSYIDRSSQLPYKLLHGDKGS